MYEPVELEPCFSSDEIRSAVARLAGELSRDYAGRTPVLVGVLKGSFVFLADLVRLLSIPSEVDFIRARSYGTGTQSSGTVEITKGPDLTIAGRHVVVVEDISDTGLTLRVIVERLEQSGAASVRTCALLAREGRAKPDYLGLWVRPGFVVGYGIDFAEGLRGLPDIRIVRQAPVD